MRRLRLQMMAGEQQNLFLDFYPNAAAAYSFRKLRAAYSGSAIRVRRASDNAEQNIGFDINGDLDTSALTAFCSGTNGFVTTWYDQSGGLNNATQTTAVNQPQIYSVATGIITLGGIPSLNFDGSNDYFNLNNFLTFGNVTALSVFGDLFFPQPSPRFYDLYDGLNHLQFVVDNSEYKVKYDLWQPALNATSFGAISTIQQLNFMLATNGANSLYVNSVNKTATPSTNVGSGGLVGKIGARADLNAVTFVRGKFQEIIIYQSNQIANRTGIENNIKTYYGIP